MISLVFAVLQLVLVLALVWHSRRAVRLWREVAAQWELQARVWRAIAEAREHD